jgi:type IV pilus biogenesis protein CpaD/CtpE
MGKVSKMSQTKLESRPAVAILSVLAAALLSGCVTDEELQGKFRPYRIEDRYPLTSRDAILIRKSNTEELCNNWTEDMADSQQNSIHPNHGCAVRVNIAKQLADPADLDNPNAATLASAARRVVVVNRLDTQFDTVNTGGTATPTNTSD